MALSVSTGQVTAQLTGSVSTGFPSPTGTQTAVVVSNGKTATSVTGGTGLLLYTVTAGKTFYVTSLSIASVSGANPMGFRDGTTIAGTNKVGVYGQITSQNMTFPTAIPFTAGIFFDPLNTSTFNWTIAGFEQ